ncbi:protein sprouty [Drosophila takahashii]|uniref:protein sprouty n=1 Tax=Drosophila takahashii TaxID=29030 RepID=UPI001CF83B62|nr:protein sprouty [Drosophila takahashii]XP_017011423.2 protein sprouty [Drosophila takahashii]
MDRRNGGDPLAPPRPPKLLPRVHRPRAPEPTLSGIDQVSVSSVSSATSTIHTNNNSQQQQLSISTAAASNNNNNNNNTISIIPASPDFDDYQIHHLTFLPQRPSSLSRNSSTASSTTATGISVSGSGSVSGSSSSFTRRRPPAIPIPLVNNNNNNFLSHFQSAGEPASSVNSLGQPPASPVTLAQPRPESERLTNEYVDTPLQHATRAQHPAGQQDNGQTTTHHLLLLPQRNQHLQQQHQQQQQMHQQHMQQQHARLATTTTQATSVGSDHTDGLLHSHLQSNSTNSKPPASKQQQQQPGPRLGLGLGLGLNQPIITKQPTQKEHMHALEELLQPGGGTGGANNGPLVMSGDPSLSNPIVCPRCGRCRCEQCQSPRPLPQTWVCNKTCLCSAESIIDYASCLCCAKALFYHCARDNDLDCDDGNGTPCVDNPCSCGPYKRTQRWGWLGALSIFLPCLWFYWPMRGCMKLCEKCYGRFAGRGCRCQGGSMGGGGGGSGIGGAGGAIGSTSSMLPIVPLGVNGNSLGGGINLSSGTEGALNQANGKAMEHGCSAARSILRKGDLTPEKRLLDSSPDY